MATGPPTGAAAPRSTTPARVLVIAGSDSGGGAGIQADVRACMANHAYAATAISALTVQNSHGVHGVHVPPVDTVEEQMTAVLGDIGADAIKTGMLPTAEIVRKVAQVRTPLPTTDTLLKKRKGLFGFFRLKCYLEMTTRLLWTLLYMSG